MVIEKAILAVVTTNNTKITGGAPIFICESKNELQTICAKLEAITDGIAHALSEELYIVVKH